MLENKILFYKNVLTTFVPGCYQCVYAMVRNLSHILRTVAAIEIGSIGNDFKLPFQNDQIASWKTDWGGQDGESESELLMVQMSNEGGPK